MSLVEPGLGLQALNDHIAVSRIDLHREATALDALRRDRRRAAAGERLIDGIATFAVVDHGATHALLIGPHRVVRVEF